VEVGILPLVNENDVGSPNKFRRLICECHLHRLILRRNDSTLISADAPGVSRRKWSGKCWLHLTSLSPGRKFLVGSSWLKVPPSFSLWASLFPAKSLPVLPSRVYSLLSNKLPEPTETHLSLASNDAPRYYRLAIESYNALSQTHGKCNFRLVSIIIILLRPLSCTKSPPTTAAVRRPALI